MNRGGISAVVATVLIILITVAGVTVIWTAIIPMIREGVVFSDLEGRVSIVTSEGYTTYDGQRKLAMVQIKREIDDGVINRTRVIFSINGSSYGSIVVAPGPGLTRVYIFNLSKYGEPDSVSIVPIFVEGNSEKEGSVTSKVMMPIGIISVISGTIYDLENDSVSIVTECNDGIDNDGDTFIDMSDSGCVNSSDDSEFTLIVTECNDGIDNDGDTFIDFPNDSGCTDSSDNNETTVAPISISFIRSVGNTGTSVTLDIGTTNNRLVVIVAGDENSGSSLTGVTVDGNNCNLVVSADNPFGIGNHQEMWYCDEDDLGSSSGSVTVSLSGGNSGWATHAHLYTGVDQSGFKDSGRDDTSLDTTITVTGISVSANGLIVMGAGNGESGNFGDGGWTSPLIEQTDGPDPSSAVLATASGIEISAQTSKTYVATASLNFNRGTGTVGVWDVAV